MDKMEGVQILVLRSALKLECLGMKRSRRPSAYQIVKDKMGFKGNKESVLKQLNDYITKEMGCNH